MDAALRVHCLQNSLGPVSGSELLSDLKKRAKTSTELEAARGREVAVLENTEYSGRVPNNIAPNLLQYSQNRPSTLSQTESNPSTGTKATTKATTTLEYS